MHVAAVLITLQVLGQTVLDFRLSVAQILICLAVGAGIEFAMGVLRDKVIMWPASGLLTGNSTAFILRVPGTLHGQWWSLHGIWIFIGVVAVSMASKYLIRIRGRHVFNPSNLGLVLAFVVLGPRFTEPQDLWWIPFGSWMIVTYAVLIVGGLLIGWELRLLGLELGFLVAFAAFAALALLPAPDHCMVASWRATPMCGSDLWQILVTSPELLVFGLFMIPDPRTVPESGRMRLWFGVLVALLAVLLLGPTQLEFWTKAAILASLVLACPVRFLLEGNRLAAPAPDALRPRIHGGREVFGRLAGPMVVLVVGAAALPIMAQAAAYGLQPPAELSDGSIAVLPLKVGGGTDPGAWLVAAAGRALPPVGLQAVPGPASTQVWVLPPIPPVTLPANVVAFDSSMTPSGATNLVHAAVLDLVIEAEARRSHDPALAATAASGAGLTLFQNLITQDAAAGKVVVTTYSFDSAALTLYLPKFSTQAPRLIGATLVGTVTTSTTDSFGASTTVNSPYNRSWGVAVDPQSGRQLIVNDYTGLALAG